MTSRVEAPHGATAQRQHGQVLALLLMLLAALLGSLLFVFNSGQIVAAKLRLVGAADAAAYSGALAEARSLNFQAYMNRAIVANEVAIAQFVSLRSWSGYVNQALQRAATIGSLYPPVGAALRSVSQTWASVDRGLQRTLPPLESAASHWNVDVLSSAEYLSDAQTTALVASLAREVAVANEPAPGAVDVGREFVAANELRWRQYTEGHGRAGAAARAASRSGHGLARRIHARARLDARLAAAADAAQARRHGPDRLRLLARHGYAVVARCGSVWKS